MIVWDRVTKLSQFIAIILGVAIFGLGFWLGQYSQMPNGPASMASSTPEGEPVINDVTFACDGAKTIHAIFKQESVQLLLSDGRNLTVPHAISADGARYASADESFVFWNKGNGAFITEGNATTYNNCVITPLPL